LYEIGFVPDAQTLADELLVKLFAGYLVGEEMIVAKLERHAHQHQQRLKIYEEIERQYFAEPESFNAEQRSHYLTLRCGIHYEQGWLRWYEEAQAFLPVDRR
jgi:hypothetical protein